MVNTPRLTFHEYFCSARKKRERKLEDRNSVRKYSAKFNKFPKIRATMRQIEGVNKTMTVPEIIYRRHSSHRKETAAENTMLISENIRGSAAYIRPRSKSKWRKTMMSENKRNVSRPCCKSFATCRNFRSATAVPRAVANGRRRISGFFSRETSSILALSS